MFGMNMSGSSGEEGLVVMDVEEIFVVVRITSPENISQEEVVDVVALSETVSQEDVDDIVASSAILQSWWGEAKLDDSSSLLITDCEDVHEDIALFTLFDEVYEWRTELSQTMVAVDTFKVCDEIGKEETGWLKESDLDGSGDEVPGCCDCCDVDATDIAGVISFSADEVLVVTCVEEIEKGLVWSMLLHREVEEGLRAGDDDIVDESMKCCLWVTLSVTCCVDEGFDAESEELLQREGEVGRE